MAGRNRFAQRVSVGARKIMPHEMRINIRVGTCVCNVKSDPAIRLDVGGSQSNALHDNAGAPVLDAADKDVEAAEVLLYFINGVLNFGGHIRPALRSCRRRRWP